MKPLLYIAFATLLGGLSLGAHASADLANGKQIAAQKCQACHGADGNSTTAQFPRLAGQYANYMEHSLKQYRSGERSNPIMAGQAAGLSDQDIKDVSAWFASQSGLIQPERPRTR